MWQVAVKILQRRTDTIAKILIRTFNDDEEKAIEKVLSVLSDEIGLEPVKATTSRCQSSVASVICNLRKKIEPDSKNPTYIKKDHFRHRLQVCFRGTTTK